MLRELIRKNILVAAVVIGFIGGLLALAYYGVLRLLLHLVWTRAFGIPMLGIFHISHPGWILVLITTLGGLLVGCSLKFLGAPGEISAVVDNINLQYGRIDIKQTPSMITNSLFSITAGGSAGPEAPLVQIIGSFGSWLGERMDLSDEEIRIYTFCGMATALGAFFGSPIGGALFSLEIPHRRGLEYYEALLPSCLAALVGFLVFRAVLGWESPVYAQPALKEFSYCLLLMAVGFGVLGALVGWLFAFLFQLVEHVSVPFHKYPVLMATVGGALLGGLALFCPQTLFWGEFQIPSLLHLVASPSHLLVIAALKMLAVALTLHFGFRGGFIFPLFFIGVAVGLALSAVFPAVPTIVATLALAAAVNVAVTKTPISTTIILTTLSGANLLPIIALASFTSFVVGARVEVIHGQRSRQLAYNEVVESR